MSIFTNGHFWSSIAARNWISDTRLLLRNKGRLFSNKDYLFHNDFFPVHDIEPFVAGLAFKPSAIEGVPNIFPLFADG